VNALNAIPVLGWLLAAIICGLASVPVYFLWNWLAPMYFSFLPSQYLNLPYMHVIGLMWLIASLRGIFLPSCSQTVNKK
jgi:hypothetical protein